MIERNGRGHLCLPHKISHLLNDFKYDFYSWHTVSQLSSLRLIKAFEITGLDSKSLSR